MSSTTTELSTPSPAPGQRPRRLGGLLILAVVNLVMVCLLGLWKIILDAADVGAPALEPLAPGTSVHQALWTAFLVFDLAARATLFIACIVLLVLLFKKRSVVPRFMVWLCGVGLAVSVVALVGIETVGIPALRAAGLPDDADMFMVFNIIAVVRAVAMAALWIPYFSVSERVRNTFVTRRRAVPAAVGPFAPSVDLRTAGQPIMHEPNTPVEVGVPVPDSPLVNDDVPWWKVPRWYHWLAFAAVAFIIYLMVARGDSWAGRILITVVAGLALADIQRTRGRRRKSLAESAERGSLAGAAVVRADSVARDAELSLAATGGLVPEPDGPAPDAPDLFDFEQTEGFHHGSGYVVQRLLKARPEQVKRAADEWASSCGWTPTSSNGDVPAYRWGGLPAVRRGEPGEGAHESQGEHH